MIKNLGKIQKNILVAIVGLVAIVLIIVYLIYKNHSLKPNEGTGANNADQTDQQQPSTGDFVEPIVTPPEDEGGFAPVSAVDFYSQGFIKFQNQHYAESISDFDSAISLDPENANYYAKKSEAQYNLGNKEQAIQTVEDGLKVLPDNDLLKTKLDILKKEWFGNQPQ